jgi:hypothetical protein
MARFADMLEEAQQWTVVFWDDSIEFLNEVVGVVRFAVSRGKRKFGFLDRLPYIIGHLGYLEGAREKIRFQFAESAPRFHHRVSRKLCEPGELSEAMDSMVAHTDLSDSLLRWYVHGIRELPFNDDVCEQPHALFSKEHSHSNASTIAWKSASVRLPQNLADLHHMCACTNLSLQSVYDGCKQVVQTGSSLRAVRCSRKVFETTMYRCSHRFHPNLERDDPLGLVNRKNPTHRSPLPNKKLT